MKSRAVAIDLEGEPSLSVEGLEELERALKRADPVDGALKAQLLELISYLLFDLIIVKRKGHRGRRVATATWTAAAIAERLIDKHQAKVKDAVRAVVGKNDKYVQRVERALRKFKGGHAHGISVADEIVEKAAAALPHKIRK